VKLPKNAGPNALRTNCFPSATAKEWFERRFQSERDVSMKNSKSPWWLRRQPTVASSRLTRQSDIRRTSDAVCV